MILSERRWLSVVLVASLALLHSNSRAADADLPRPSSDSVTRTLHISSALRDVPDRGRVVATTVDLGEVETWETEVELVGGAGKIGLPLDEERSWKVHVFAEGTWSRTLDLRRERGGEEPTDSVSTVLWPAATLRARWTFPKDADEGGESVVLRLSGSSRSAATPRDQPEGPIEIPCPISSGESRETTCTIPAGRWNLRLTVPPLAPHFEWDRKAPRSKALDLGIVELKRGGSLTGLVETELGAVEPDRTRVWIEPVSLENAEGSRVEEELAQLNRRAEIGPTGQFRILGVTPGRYQIRATHPGFFSATRSPIGVEEGKLTELAEPLRVKLPARLDLSVQPIAQLDGSPWTVVLSQLTKTGRLKQAAKGETDEAGFWSSPPVEAGSYTLWIVDAEGNHLADRRVEIEGGTQSEQVEIPLVYVEGEVLLAGTPVAATLVFSLEGTYQHVTTESDHSGTFVAVLPEPGTWLVDVEGSDPPVRSENLEVEIEPIADLGLAEVTIELPDTAVSGRVVDSSGAAIQETAVVRLVRVDGPPRPVGIWTESGGRFELRGVAPGKYSLFAETRDASSTPEMIEVKGGAGSAFTLTLKAQETLHGIVTSEKGPVAGATVLAYMVSGSGSGPTLGIEESRTSGDGSFTLPQPAGIPAVRLVLMAAGYDLGIATIDSTRDEHELRIGRSGGTLHIKKADRLLRRGHPETGLLIIDGEPIDLPKLVDWGRRNGGGLREDGTAVLPAMPAGHYVLCPMHISEALLVIDRAALPSPDGCAEGFLNPGGETVLSTRYDEP